MNKAISAVLIFFIGTLAINAVEVNMTPGNLSSLIQTNKNITSLKITGSMDVRDFKFIADSLPDLTELDFKQVTIEAYNSLIPYFGSKIKYEANSLPHLCMFGKEYTSVILPDNLKSIDEGAFAYCKKLTTISFPESLESIGDYSFYECETIKSVIIPVSVRNINGFAFSKCSGLENLTMNNGAEVNIGNHVFSKCHRLKNIKLSENLKQIGAGAFFGCKNINSVIFPGKLEFIKEEAFMETSLIDVDLSKCKLLKSIGEWSFADNMKLESVLLPDGLESLGEGAFFFNTALQKISLPQNISQINNFLFSKCSAMDSEKILPEEIKEIGDYAFYNWSNLSRFYFPASLEKIGNNAFEGCNNVSMFTIHALVPPALGDKVFAGIDQHITPLSVLEGTDELYRNSDQWKEFKVTTDPGTVTETETGNQIKIFFRGKNLYINARSDIKEIKMYDMSGTTLISRKPGISSVMIETDNYAGRFYIVSVMLVDNSIHNYKLIRE